MKKIKLNDIVKVNQSGEWGTGLKEGEIGTKVIRTADFNNDGSINYDNVIFRNIQQKKIDEKKLIYGDIIIEKSGGTDKNPVGRVVFFNDDNNIYLSNNFTQVIRIKESMNSKFVFYNLYFNYKNGSTLQMFNKTTGIQNLQMKQFLNQKISYISLEEQEIAVRKLENVRNIIEIKQKQLQDLDKLIKSQFVEMFGDVGKNDKNWKYTTLGKECFLNPKKSELKNMNENFEVSFVAMPSVSENGNIDTNIIKKYDDVKKGFTYFAENDVLFAKITPCMENGKGAVAVGLKNKIGFGSTEFHVLRPKENINSVWLYTLTAMKSFRIEAERKMTGSAGQKRVPISFFETYNLGLPPIELQNQFADIVKQIDKQKFEIQKSLKEMQNLQESLMNKYFG